MGEAMKIDEIGSDHNADNMASAKSRKTEPPRKTGKGLDQRDGAGESILVLSAPIRHGGL